MGVGNFFCGKRNTIAHNLFFLFCGPCDGQWKQHFKLRKHRFLVHQGKMQARDETTPTQQISIATRIILGRMDSSNPFTLAKCNTKSPDQGEGQQTNQNLKFELHPADTRNGSNWRIYVLTPVTRLDLKLENYGKISLF